MWDFFKSFKKNSNLENNITLGNFSYENPESCSEDSTIFHTDTYCTQIVLYQLLYVQYVYTTCVKSLTSVRIYTHPKCFTTWVCKFLFEWSYFWMNEFCLRVLEHKNSPPSSVCSVQQVVRDCWREIHTLLVVW